MPVFRVSDDDRRRGGATGFVCERDRNDILSLFFLKRSGEIKRFNCVSDGKINSAMCQFKKTRFSSDISRKTVSQPRRGFSSFFNGSLEAALFLEHLRFLESQFKT